MNGRTGKEWLSLAADKVFRSAGLASLQTLQSDVNGVHLEELVQHAHALTDSLAKEVHEIGPVAERPVCCEGCAACCYLHVVATPVEVLAIAKVMVKSMSPAAINDVRDRLDDHIEATEGLDASQRQKIRIACPLLEAGKCMIYSHRPISCRGWNSWNRSTCDADFADHAGRKSDYGNSGFRSVYVR